MTIKALIDDKRKKRVRDAIAKGDSTIFGKKKPKPEPAQTNLPVKSPTHLEAVIDSQLLRAVIEHNPNAAKEAIEKGAYTNLQTNIPGTNENCTILALATEEWRRESVRQIDSMNPGALDDLIITVNKCKEVVKLLIINGADPNVTLHGELILKHFKGNDVFNLLKKHGAKE